MVNLTLSVSSELKQKLNSHPEINWSEIARQAFTHKLEELAEFEKFISKSTLDNSEALRMGRKVSEKAHKRLLKNRS